MTYVSVRIPLSREGFANPDELRLRDRFSAQVEEAGIGKVVADGTGLGEMDIGIELSDATAGPKALRELVKQLGIEEVAIDGDLE